jgi:hypothetical protein
MKAVGSSPSGDVAGGAAEVLKGLKHAALKR